MTLASLFRLAVAGELTAAVAGRGQGTSSLRLADRLPLASQLKMTLTMKMPDNGLMKIAMDMRAKGESQAKPATKLVANNKY